jgi:hypothetical protein
LAGLLSVEVPSPAAFKIGSKPICLLTTSVAAAFKEEQNESSVPKEVGSDGSELVVKCRNVNFGKSGLLSMKFFKNSELLKVSRLPLDEVMSGEKIGVLGGDIPIILIGPP